MTTPDPTPTPLFRVLDAEGRKLPDLIDFFIDRDGDVWGCAEDTHNTPHIEIERRCGYRVEWLRDPITGGLPRRRGV